MRIEDEVHVIPDEECRRCRTRLDDATPVSDDSARPEPGSVSICWYCGTVSLFDDDLRLREPTIEEVENLLDRPVVAALLDRLWADRLARVVKGRGVDFACGCRTTAAAGLFTLEACAESCAAARTVIRMLHDSEKPVMVIR